MRTMAEFHETSVRFAVFLHQSSQKWNISNLNYSLKCLVFDEALIRPTRTLLYSLKVWQDWETFPVTWSGTLASPPMKDLLSEPRGFLPSAKLSEKCFFFSPFGCC